MGTGLPPRLLLERIRLLLNKGQAAKAEAMVRRSDSLHNTDPDGTTALHYAALDGDVEAMRVLLNAGLYCNTSDTFGYTPLHRAAAQGHRDVIRLLLERGCNANAQDAAHGFSALHEAAWHGYSESLNILLLSGANVHAMNKSGFSALHLASQNGHNQSTRVLLMRGANPDARNAHGDTALHTAARYGHAGVTRILISARARVDELNENGDTPLHIAAALKRRKVAQLLVEAYADRSIRNRQHDTAMDIALRKGHSQLVTVLQTTVVPPNPFSNPGPEYFRPQPAPFINLPASQFASNLQEFAMPDASTKRSTLNLKERTKRGFLNLFKRNKKSSATRKSERNESTPHPNATVVEPVPMSPGVTLNERTVRPIMDTRYHLQQQAATGWPQRPPLYAPMMYPATASFASPHRYDATPNSSVFAYYPDGTYEHRGPPAAPVQMLQSPPRAARPHTQSSRRAALTASRLVRSRSDESLSMSDSKAKANDERARKVAAQQLGSINQFYRYVNAKPDWANTDAPPPVVGRRGAQMAAEQSAAQNAHSIVSTQRNSVKNASRQPQFYVPFVPQPERKRQHTRQRVPADIDDDDDDLDDSSSDTVDDDDLSSVDAEQTLNAAPQRRAVTQDSTYVPMQPLVNGQSTLSTMAGSAAVASQATLLSPARVPLQVQRSHHLDTGTASVLSLPISSYTQSHSVVPSTPMAAMKLGAIQEQSSLRNLPVNSTGHISTSTGKMLLHAPLVVASDPRGTPLNAGSVLDASVTPASSQNPVFASPSPSRISARHLLVPIDIDTDTHSQSYYANSTRQSVSNKQKGLGHVASVGSRSDNSYPDSGYASKTQPSVAVVFLPPSATAQSHLPAQPGQLLPNYHAGPAVLTPHRTVINAPVNNMLNSTASGGTPHQCWPAASFGMRSTAALVDTNSLV